MSVLFGSVLSNHLKLMEIQEFFLNLPGPNRFLMIMAFLLLILYFTYRNLREREQGQDELKQKINALREAVDQKGTRINEIHHRIKNNLQILSHMFEADMDRIEEIDWKKRLQTYRSRVNSIGMIHDVLNTSTDQEFLALKPYLERVVHHSSQLLNNLTSGVNVNTDIEPMKIDCQMATTCGLITTELMMNCYQHAFDDGDDARIDIRLQQVNGHVEFTVKDNGSGAAEANFQEESDSLGSDIVSSLVKSNLKGEIEINTLDSGTEIRVTFPAVYGSTGK